jgi:phosphatidylinositol alpha-mannosyltransferase
VVHVHEPIIPSTSMLAVMQANAPVVATFHANVPHGTLQSAAVRALAPFFRPVWYRIDRRLAVSRAARDSICGRMGSGDVRIVPNGVDVQVFASARPALLPPGRMLLFVGRLEPRKGFPVAVRAFGRVARDYPDTRLVVVGDGADRDAVNELDEQARSRVLMLGRVSQEALPTYYRAADIFLAPAVRGESFGIVLVEAMAAGLPVLGSDIPGYREVTRHGVEGLLVPPDDPELLAVAMRRLLDNPAYAKSLGDNGSVRAREFDWDTIVHQLEDVYAELAMRTAERPMAGR